MSETAPSEKGEATSFRHSLKGASIVGTSQIASMVLGIIRSKLTASGLGTAGLGLLGALTSSIGLVQSLSGMGVARSSVRPVAAATDPAERALWASTALAASSFLGLTAGIAVAVFADALSNFTFGSSEYTTAFQMLSLTVPLAAFSTTAIALLQGARLTRDYAQVQIASALLGTIGAAAIVFLLGPKGVVPYIVATTVLTCATVVWTLGRETNFLQIPRGAQWRHFRELFVLGLTFSLLDIFGAAVNYSRNSLLFRLHGADAAGLYQAASSLSTVFVGLVMTAIGTNLLPTLVSVEKEDRNRITNEQIEIALLVAAPFVAWSALLAPTLMSAFFAKAFAQGSGVFRILLVAAIVRIFNWPIGFLLLSNRKDRQFLLTDFVSGGFEWALSIAAILFADLESLGFAIAISQLVSIIWTQLIAHRSLGFAWSRQVRGLTAFCIPLLAISIWGGAAETPASWPFACGALATAAISVLCGRWLLQRTQYLAPDSKVAKLLRVIHFKSK